ncbi:glycoside hydrolase family 99-like domain-containing protein [Herbiconiux moechotypicola]|uniref:Glycoside hydrolase family 99-like domain-containing protein n=1 Tax=Herbiconiux moechotypicola TaxID=637393 RepID=A0ABN3DV58_9MICO|nr:glycoside hydrolase family 99-like domain-containing protein [Herbiconiux moechotypicola]MCS5731012.1 glycoside hydrolase family 99-like domain-containing protein [Herbiconiux moechotypicola]
MRKITIGGVKRRTGRVLKRAGDVLAETPVPVEPPSFPASFATWSAGRSGRLKALYPGEWKKQFLPEPPTSRVAVVVHVFYTDLVEQILTSLESMPVPFDLIVTNSSGESLELDTSRLGRLDRVHLFDIANHGRDILPLISVVNAGLLDPYEIVFKVHTKKSVWREAHTELGGSGEQWRESFFSELAGSAETFERILGEFASDPGLGILTSTGNVLGPEFWGGDREIVGSLLARIQTDFDEEALRFAAGSIYWVRGFLLQGLRSLELTAADFEEEAGQVDATTAHAVERILGIVTGIAGYDIREAGALTEAAAGAGAFERWLPETEVVPRARVIPFYLPQFHTFPENDEWWEKGFTEWSNVAAGTPLYPGHIQPFLPSELGYYDLRTPGVRDAQYALAEWAGIEGFMYYYYWFAGKKLMDLPVEDLHASDADQPFCLMWANENWTRRWDGSEKNILIAQDYDRVSAKQFIDDVLHLITDPRYIRIDDKPVIAVYRITQIPDHVEVIAHWRKVAEEAGLPGLTLITVDVGTSMQGVEGELAAHGLDAYLEFAPHNMYWGALPRDHRGLDERFQGNLLSYPAMAEKAEERLNTTPPAHRYPGVMVNFDNTARRQWQPDMWYGSNPYVFRRWLNTTVSSVADRDRDERVVFVNAWNEWAEGAVLEPSQRWARTYLLAVRDVLHR